MAILHFTLKEVRKNKLRTIIIITIIALIISIPTLFNNVIATLNNTEVNSYHKENVADITIISQNKHFNSSTRQILKEQVRNIKLLEKRIFVWGVATKDNKNAVITIEGVPSNFSLNNYEFLTSPAGFQEGGCFVEYIGGKYLNWKLNEEVSIVGENGTFNLQILSFVRASWAVSYSVPKQIQIFVPLTYLEKQLNLTNNYNGIRVRIKDVSSIYETVEKIKSVLNENGWLAYVYISSGLALSSQIYMVKNIFLVISYPILFIGIAIIITILVQQSEIRFRETALMKVVGFSKKQIILYYSYQMMLWGLAGGAIGILLALIIHVLIVKMLLMPLLGAVIFTIDVNALALNLLITLSLLGLFSLIPALKAYRLAAVSVLRYGKGHKKAKAINVNLPFSNLFNNSVRHLLRKRKQTITFLTGISVAVALSTAVAFVSINESTTISNMFLAGHKYDSLIFTTDTISNKNLTILKSVNTIKKFEGYLWAYGESRTLIQHNNKNFTPDSGILLIGTNETNALYRPVILKGRLPHFRTNEIVISYKLSKITGLRINSTFILNTTIDNTHHILQNFTVCGIGAIILQNSMAFLLDISFLSTLIGKTSLVYNAIAITFSATTSVSNSLQQCLEQLSSNNISISNALIKDDIYKGLKGITSSFGVILYIFAIIIMIALCIGIFNYILSNINERKRELTLLRAIGGTKKDILKTLLYELLILCTIIIIVGSALSYFIEKGIIELINSTPFPLWIIGHFSFAEITMIVLALLGSYFLGILVSLRLIIFREPMAESLRETFIF